MKIADDVDSQYFLFHLRLLYVVTSASVTMNGDSDIGAVGGEENIEIDR